jgi:hypothetical protein
MDDSRVSRSDEVPALSASLAEAKVMAAEALSKLQSNQLAFSQQQELLKLLTAANAALEVNSRR